MSGCRCAKCRAHGLNAVTSWSVRLTRDHGGEFWRWPRVSAWHPRGTAWNKLASGFRVRIGWRWTAWILSGDTARLSETQVQTITRRAYAERN